MSSRALRFGALSKFSVVAALLVMCFQTLGVVKGAGTAGLLEPLAYRSVFDSAPEIDETALRSWMWVTAHLAIGLLNTVKWIGLAIIADLAMQIRKALAS